MDQIAFGFSSGFWQTSRPPQPGDQVPQVQGARNMFDEHVDWMGTDLGRRAEASLAIRECSFTIFQFVWPGS